MMVAIAYIIVVFAVVQFMIATANLIAETKLPPGKDSDNALVSVLIPARNEEVNIGTILNDLVHQHYKNIEVIVFNDLSGDRTAEIVEQFALLDTRIKLINSDILPDGWLGKNYACFSLSSVARGEYLLFLDADVRLGSNIIGNAISYLRHHHLGLLSIFPKQIIKSFGERITVPNMNYILLSLLPLFLVRKSGFSSLAAANGQFMFFNAGTYRLLSPHEKMKNNKVEDIAIARYFKNEKHPIACMLGDETIQCRMYAGFSDAVNGFSKNVTAFFGNSLSLSLLFWLATTFGWLIVLFFLPDLFFISYIIVILLTRIIISWVSEQDIVDNVLYTFLQQIACGLFIYKALLHKYSKNHQWKGRNIS
jgi:glycosyltransferase involved in cell wall biosynthesis